MGRKYTYTEVKEIIESKGYKLIDKEYINSNVELTLKDEDNYYYYVTLRSFLTNKAPYVYYKSNIYSIQNIKNWLIVNNKDYELITDKYESAKSTIVLKDTKGYYYSTTLNDLTHNITSNKFHVSNPYTIQNIKLWCKINKIPVELISEIYKGNDKKLKWKCLKDNCGSYFLKEFRVIQQGFYCTYCGVTNSLSYDDVVKILSKYNLILLDTEYKNVYKKFTVKDKEGYFYLNNLANILASETSERFHTSNSYTIQNIKLWCKINNKSFELISNKYEGATKKLQWRCLTESCGETFKTSWNCISRNIGCPFCCLSKGEDSILNYLKLHNINNIPQKIFNNLLGLGGGNLSYDFNLPEYNLLIEFQGIQHEKYIKGLHKSKKDFEKQQEHDKRKREYAQYHKYNFLEIWYWDFDKIEEILDKELNNIKIKAS